MKHLSFHYHLKIDMDAPISAHHFTLRCMPQTDARQQITNTKSFIFPGDFISESRDHWDNVLLYGSCRHEHSSFEANVCGEALLDPQNAIPCVSEARSIVFGVATALTHADPVIQDAAACLRSENHLKAAEDAMSLIHSCMTYVPKATTVHTSAADAYALGQGVCQDYAHIMLAMLRSRSIPCRYVTGMLLGEGESHAWVEVLHDGKWYAFDPTNYTAVTDQHIKIAHGRDALDCAINRGVFRGFAGQKTDISVIVAEQ